MSRRHRGRGAGGDQLPAQRIDASVELIERAHGVSRPREAASESSDRLPSSVFVRQHGRDGVAAESVGKARMIRLVETELLHDAADAGSHARWSPSRLIPHCRGPRAELQPAHELRVDMPMVERSKRCPSRPVLSTLPMIAAAQPQASVQKAGERHRRRYTSRGSNVVATLPIAPDRCDRQLCTTRYTMLTLIPPVPTKSLGADRPC